jgi:peptide/nickel transport system permease protein
MGAILNAFAASAARATRAQAAADRERIRVREQKVRADHTKVKLIAFSAMAILVLAVAVFAPWLCPYDPYAQNLSEALQAPSASHLAGTDRYGRDLLSRIIMGSQSSIFSTLALVAIIAVVGTVVGVLCGWKTGKLDVVLMRTSDVFLAFPGLVFALAIAGVLGGGMMNAVIALAAISWPKYARIARGLTLAQKNEPYLSAARLAGCSTAQLLFRHILPNIAGPLLVTAMLDIGTMMMELAGLSFLGLGAQPPVAEWGSMMSDNRSLLQTAPWTIVAPGIAIFVAVMTFNLLGDTIRDWMDPSHREKG